MRPLPSRTRRFARVLRALSLALAGATVAVLFWAGWDSDFLVRQSFDATGARNVWEVNALARVLLWCIAAAQSAAAVLALWSAAVLFDHYAQGEAVSARVALASRRIGYWLGIVALFLVVTPTLQSLALSIDAAPGSRMLVLALDSRALGFGVAAGLLFIVGTAMRQATAMADELDGFV